MDSTKQPGWRLEKKWKVLEGRAKRSQFCARCYFTTPDAYSTRTSVNSLRNWRTLAHILPCTSAASQITTEARTLGHPLLEQAIRSRPRLATRRGSLFAAAELKEKKRLRARERRPEGMAKGARRHSPNSTMNSQRFLTAAIHRRALYTVGPNS